MCIEYTFVHYSHAILDSKSEVVPVTVSFGLQHDRAAMAGIETQKQVCRDGTMCLHEKLDAAHCDNAFVVQSPGFPALCDRCVL